VIGIEFVNNVKIQLLANISIVILDD